MAVQGMCVYLRRCSTSVKLFKSYDSQDIISFDGKTLCGTAEKALGIKGLHILNAWSTEDGICIGQLKLENV